MTLPCQQQLATLRAALTALQQGGNDIAGLCTVWRASGDLMTALPPRYQEVAEDLLGRLEAGSLFTEESCSFSQKDLTDSLDTWLRKAGQILTQA